MRKSPCIVGLIATLVVSFGVADQTRAASLYDSFGYESPPEFKLSDHLFDDLDVGGWLQAGYTSESTGLFNTVDDRLNLNQAWIYVEKDADGSDGLDWGFRVDMMYGVDADDTQAFGNDPGVWDFENDNLNHGVYGWAFPQVYFEAAYKDFSLIAGHFYTLLGYEVVPAPGNFFYSHAFTMYNSEAFTHTGVLGTYEGFDNLTLYAGWTLGWDTAFDEGSGEDGGNSFLGGASYSPIDEVTLTYILTGGELGANGDGYTHSIVADVTPIENLNYVFQSDFADTDAFSSIGINQYLFYTFFDELAAGIRLEWWKLVGTSTNAVTGGVNIRPIPNLVFRPEIRYQWTPAEDYDETIFAIDSVITF